MKRVIILHGWTKNLDKWNDFLKIIEKKGTNYSMPKIPGLTGSLEKVWELADYVKWLKNIVDKEKDIVILVGHSNGGRIALNFVIKYPQKLSKLILIDSAGIYHNELSIRMKRLFFSALAKIGKKLTSSEKLKGFLYKMTGERDYKNASIHMMKTMINLMKSDMSLDLEKVDVPTLIIWGENDKVLPLKDGRKMEQKIKNSKLEVIKDARHSPQFTHPNQVAEAIVNNLTI